MFRGVLPVISASGHVSGPLRSRGPLPSREFFPLPQWQGFFFTFCRALRRGGLSGGDADTYTVTP